jgi:glycoside/pentoside/hexuronide:cation symporter, GPH family
VMGLPASVVGLGVAASLVLDAVIDPYIGHLSDRTRHPLGRRHIFMLPAALATGPLFFLLFSPPRGMSKVALFLWLVVSSILLRVASAIYRIPYLSLGAELSQDYDDRTSTMAIRAFFGLVGTLAATGLSFLLFFPRAANGSEPKLRYEAYPHLGLAFGALMTAAGLVGFFGTLKFRSWGAGQGSPGPRFFSGFLISMRNRSLRSIWISATVFFLAMVLNFSLSIHYFTWYARISDKAISGIQTGFYLAGVFLWMALSRRTEKRTLYIMATITSAILLLSAALLIGNGRLFGTGRALPLIVGNVIGGIFASAVWVVPSSMIADVTDSDELTTGLRREGIYFGIMNFGEKLAAGGALALSGLLLTVFGKLAHVPASSVTGAPAAAPYLGLLYGVVPAMLLVISLIFILPYRLDRRTVHGMQQQLAARRSVA